MKGDHVYCNRGTYYQHGIDCGDGTVIYYTKNQGIISRVYWTSFVSGITVFVRDYAQCDTSDIVVSRAESKLGENAHNLFANNSEHFATWCKTGKQISEEVKNTRLVGIGVVINDVLLTHRSERVFSFLRLVLEKFIALVALIRNSKTKLVFLRPLLEKVISHIVNTNVFRRIYTFLHPDLGAVVKDIVLAPSLKVVLVAGAGTGLSGAAWIMSFLADVGGIVGGGAVAGLCILGFVPATFAIITMNEALTDDKNLSDNERKARAIGRNMTTVGAAIGNAGSLGAVAVWGKIGGLSGSGITSGLAALGGIVGGGMTSGVFITVGAPAAVAVFIGYGAYELWKWGIKRGN